MITTYFGAPGSGKSTFATMLAIVAAKKGRDVFTNFPIDYPGIYKLDSSLIGVVDFRNSLLIIDEAGIEWSNRDFKRFPPATMQWFKLHRHYKCDVIVLSQGWDDMDKKIRDLSQYYFNIKKILWFSISVEYRKRVGVDQQTHQIIDEYYSKSLLSGGCKFCFRPRWYKYFDSYEAPRLPGVVVKIPYKTIEKPAEL